MSGRNWEPEDGMGFAGLVPTAQEKQEERDRERAFNRELKLREQLAASQREREQLQARLEAALRDIEERAENAGFNPWDVLRDINGIASAALFASTPAAPVQAEAKPREAVEPVCQCTCHNDPLYCRECDQCSCHDIPRCPKCGYTNEDCRTHMDHHLCGEPEPPSKNEADAPRGQHKPCAWMIWMPFSSYPPTFTTSEKVMVEAMSRADIVVTPLYDHPPASVAPAMQTDGVRGWRPIETAPIDGEHFLAWVDRHVRIVSWGKTSHVPIYGFCLRDQGPEDSDICEPTHWMPLPEPPK